MDLKDFKKGDRVQLHPAVDRWMRGDRFGEVLLVGRRKLTLKMDRSGDVIRVAPRNIQERV